MFQPTVDSADAASVLFNLPDYVVVEVKRDACGAREVFIQTLAVEAGCPSCGVVTGRVHQRTTQRIPDVTFNGQIAVWWIKKRWRCTETGCVRTTFTEHTQQNPRRTATGVVLKIGRLECRPAFPTKPASHIGGLD